MNKEFLEVKKQMQNARNISKTLHGIKIIHLYEPGEGDIAKIDFRSMGVYGSYKKPDMIINLDVTEQWVADFLKSKTGLANGNVIYLLLHNGIWAEIEVLDVDLFIVDFLTSEYRSCYFISFIDAEMKKMYEFGSDSRDEYHRLYDEYNIKFV